MLSRPLLNSWEVNSLMAWSNNSSGSKFSARTKRIVKHRDQGTCQLQYPGCTGVAEQLDHITNLATLGISRSDPEADDPNNLQSVCRSCHTKKTQAEAHAAKRAKRFRKPLQHPGLIQTPDPQ
jgi:5-methylcytosine-specific restriction endonuclease McrA